MPEITKKKNISILKLILKHSPSFATGALIGLLNVSFWTMVLLAIIFAGLLAARDIVLLEEYDVNL